MMMGKDTTQARRQAKRREALARAAREAGWKGWSDFETAVVNGKVKLPQNPRKGGK